MAEFNPTTTVYSPEQYRKMITSQICANIMRNSADVRWCRLGLEWLKFERDVETGKQNASDYEAAIKPLLKKVGA